jgi:disulfide bond formation protein DsbB
MPVVTIQWMLFIFFIVAMVVFVLPLEQPPIPL